MRPAPTPENDEARVASLERMNLLSTPREADLDRITRTTQKVFHTEIALISLVDKDRHWFKSRCGLDAPQTPRDISFCGHAIHDDHAFVVNDAATDERFHDNPLVTGGPKVKFYAGQPLINTEGFRIGTLCIISSKARDFTEEETQILQDLGRMVEIVMDNRDLSDTQQTLLETLATAQRDKLIDPLTGVWNRGGLEELCKREISRATRENSAIAVAMIDIDNFKEINDTFGHAHGDEAIKLTAELLVEGARATDIVARYGGDEFAVIAPGIVPANLPTLGEKLMRLFRTKAKLHCPQGECLITVSIGIALVTPKKNTPIDMKNLLELADRALYEAKERGRNRFEILGTPDSLYTDFALA